MNSFLQFSSVGQKISPQVEDSSTFVANICIVKLTIFNDLLWPQATSNEVKWPHVSRKKQVGVPVEKMNSIVYGGMNVVGKSSWEDR